MKLLIGFINFVGMLFGLIVGITLIYVGVLDEIKLRSMGVIILIYGIISFINFFKSTNR